MAAHAPAATAAPGMPHTTLEPLSWAITLPPASAMAQRARGAVRAHAGEHDAERRRPVVRATLANRGSTAGRQ